ncbi:general vesicular transport factor p115 [Anaeramoeba flamelloides]|uniref:General vesicular transport factor p115 n=1 Tax=Anaeramoeba flamelloides TaxID=1746091 RepID=A0ABQ8Y9M5_9EUKA|nr:general vesicular transport factor p115 [Anaeramoeba flamelloides]
MSEKFPLQVHIEKNKSKVPLYNINELKNTDRLSIIESRNNFTNPKIYNFKNDQNKFLFENDRALGVLNSGDKLFCTRDEQEEEKDNKQTIQQNKKSKDFGNEGVHLHNKKVEKQRQEKQEKQEQEQKEESKAEKKELSEFENSASELELWIDQDFFVKDPPNNPERDLHDQSQNQNQTELTSTETETLQTQENTKTKEMSQLVRSYENFTEYSSEETFEFEKDKTELGLPNNNSDIGLPEKSDLIFESNDENESSLINSEDSINSNSLGCLINRGNGSEFGKNEEEEEFFKEKQLLEQEQKQIDSFMDDLFQFEDGSKSYFKEKQKKQEKEKKQEKQKTTTTTTKKQEKEEKQKKTTTTTEKQEKEEKQKKQKKQEKQEKEKQEKQEKHFTNKDQIKNENEKQKEQEKFMFRTIKTRSPTKRKMQNKPLTQKTEENLNYNTHEKQKNTNKTQRTNTQEIKEDVEKELRELEQELIQMDGNNTDEGNDFNDFDFLNFTSSETEENEFGEIEAEGCLLKHEHSQLEKFKKELKDQNSLSKDTNDSDNEEITNNRNQNKNKKTHKIKKTNFDSISFHHIMCPITFEMFIDPVKTPCGDLFERRSIEKEIKMHGVCPIHDTILKVSDLIESKETKKLVQKWKEKHNIRDPNNKVNNAKKSGKDSNDPIQGKKEFEVFLNNNKGKYQGKCIIDLKKKQIRIILPDSISMVCKLELINFQIISNNSKIGLLSINKQDFFIKFKNNSKLKEFVKNLCPSTITFKENNNSNHTSKNSNNKSNNKETIKFFIELLNENHKTIAKRYLYVTKNIIKFKNGNGKTCAERIENLKYKYFKRKITLRIKHQNYRIRFKEFKNFKKFLQILKKQKLEHTAKETNHNKLEIKQKKLIKKRSKSKIKNEQEKIIKNKNNKTKEFKIKIIDKKFKILGFSKIIISHNTIGIIDLEKNRIEEPTLNIKFQINPKISQIGKIRFFNLSKSFFIKFETNELRNNFNSFLNREQKQKLKQFEIYNSPTFKIMVLNNYQNQIDEGKLKIHKGQAFLNLRSISLKETINGIKHNKHKIELSISQLIVKKKSYLIKFKNNKERENFSDYYKQNFLLFHLQNVDSKQQQQQQGGKVKEDKDGVEYSEDIECLEDTEEDEEEQSHKEKHNFKIKIVNRYNEMLCKGEIILNNQKVIIKREDQTPITSRSKDIYLIIQNKPKAFITILFTKKKGKLYINLENQKDLSKISRLFQIVKNNDLSKPSKWKATVVSSNIDHLYKKSRVEIIVKKNRIILNKLDKSLNIRKHLSFSLSKNLKCRISRKNPKTIQLRINSKFQIILELHSTNDSYGFYDFIDKLNIKINSCKKSRK